MFHAGLGLTEMGRKLILISHIISKSFMKKKLFYKQNGPNNKKGSFKNNTVLLSTGVSGYVYHIIYYIPCVYSSNPQTHAWCQGLQRDPKTKYIYIMGRTGAGAGSGAGTGAGAGAGAGAATGAGAGAGAGSGAGAGADAGARADTGVGAGTDAGAGAGAGASAGAGADAGTGADAGAGTDTGAGTGAEEEEEEKEKKAISIKTIFLLEF